jgi:hypothetical protein
MEKCGNRPEVGRRPSIIPAEQGSPRGGRSGRRSRPIGRSFRLNIDPRELAGAVSGMLVLAVAGVIAVVAILYYTFASGSYPSSLPQFYGALAAAMVFVLLLSYVAVRLLGSGE